MENSIIGTEVDGYRIQEVLGRGGMGVVYKAEDTALSRNVALKRIAPSLANDESFLRRFRSEAQALARIDSPYIVSVHALRQTEIGLLIVMEYVAGGTLEDLMLEGPMDWPEVLPLVEQMLEALEHAHGEEVIHRDIKPQNVMLGAEKTVKVTDFGLAKVHRGDSKATVTQGVHGTLNYMSPEQVKGSSDLDHRSDLYSLGMTVYEMLAGELPFDEDSDEFAQMRTIVEEELPPPDECNSEVPDGISMLVMTALEKDPDDRFQSATEMREAFKAFEKEYRDESTAHPTTPEPPSQPAATAEEPATSSPTRWPLLAGAAALVLLLAGVGYWRFAGGGSNPPTTQFSVTTEPAGATVSLNDQQIGTVPLRGTTIEGDTAHVRVRQAGFEPFDTTLTRLAGRQEVVLDVPLSRKERSLTVESNPEASRVSIEGEDLGRTPASYTTSKGSVRVRMEHEGYFPDDTLLAVAQIDRGEFEMQLDPRPQPDPNGDDSGGNRGGNGNNTTTGNAPPTYGTLTLEASPSTSVSAEVDGESRPAGESIQVRTGRREIRISHPQYGSCEKTLTVEAEETQTLTCHFAHQVVVRSDPWAQIILDGENTGESTNHKLRLQTGETYTIKARILSRPYEVTGGTYQRIVAESYEVVAEETFQGNTKSITLRPTFKRVTHGLEFRTTQSESSQ
jgi:serine/threonine protein kinase